MIGYASLGVCLNADRLWEELETIVLPLGKIYAIPEERILKAREHFWRM